MAGKTPKGETPNPFDQAKRAFYALMDEPTVDRDVLMESVAAVETAGKEMVGANNLGLINFAVGVTAVNEAALVKNIAQGVVPPFEEGYVATLETKNDSYKVIIDNDPGAGGPGGPTDTTNAPTAGRKG